MLFISLHFFSFFLNISFFIFCFIIYLFSFLLLSSLTLPYSFLCLPSFFLLSFPSSSSFFSLSLLFLLSFFLIFINAPSFPSVPPPPLTSSCLAQLCPWSILARSLFPFLSFSLFHPFPFLPSSLHLFPFLPSSLLLFPFLHPSSSHSFMPCPVLPSPALFLSSSFPHQCSFSSPSFTL